MNINARIKDDNIDITLDSLPDTCPHCHYAGNFRHIYAAASNYDAYVSFFCPRNDCQNYFVFEYIQGDHGWYYLNRPMNGSPIGIKYSTLIKEISSNFVEIFSQSEQAENYNLKDICGVGYRKSLEFLIKDYIISNGLATRINVENKQLGPCIGDYISNPTIKEIAKRASWLGNDETHYVRKWEGMDITHLKKLIALTVHWIETEEMTRQMIAAMPDPRKV